ncbi:tyrosine-protein kinase receptor TYRO3 [Boleophthalmus pectinirostris]|uniref:tyrosine-protein kinase receptor TYRO3 n=1 Tax=Boleophthalmus pectinirostris TaxID=150288 RepID=UPI00242D93F7|nr:tyrosine-protein kinase receptor TYRO3 [Boleophthalmus pectinirostris]
MRRVLWFVFRFLVGFVVVLLGPDSAGASDVMFSRQPQNQTVTQGNAVRLGCAVLGLAEPDIVWRKDQTRIYSTDQMFLSLGELHWETFYSVRSVQQQDGGRYWCEVESGGQVHTSEPAWITVEGVPHFTSEPVDLSVVAGEPFNLSCAAVGPPDPVEVLWWVGGEQVRGAEPSPSTLHLTGVNSSVKFYCEAKNSRGVSVSRTGTVHIKVLPSAPVLLKVENLEENNVTVSWTPGFSGYSPLTSCSIQVSGPASAPVSGPVRVRVLVPPHRVSVSGLRSHSVYSLRVSCTNQLGPSPDSDWINFTTPESVPMVAPRNLTFDLSESQLTLRWAGLQENELQGKLQAYKVQWSLGSETQEPLLFKESWAFLSGPSRFLNASVQVSACTSVGCGPWTRPVLILPEPVSLQAPRSHLWSGVLLGLLGASVLGLMVAFGAHRRRKHSHFGLAFKPVTSDSLVSFSSARTFSRTQHPPQVNLDSLGVSLELKTKLEDVLIPETRLSLGPVLGKGEFGSVREALLKTEDAVQKVAVKVLKNDITASCDMEQCLKEAANMKDFNHPNVIQLIGVSLQRRPGRLLPVPMVILPFMKHGDLHTFLLLSRLGEKPYTLELQTLVGFMLDVARGMEYLSNKNIIHRDLAARNCMLGEDLSVCVADFGLSKKIYSGDYYRQGSASKLPVKWIALESLSDNVYTTQSDVWAFGVTMWEVMTRGQTPYPGVENSEIYEYLIKGERLKKPTECRADLYEVMHSCWSPVPRCRPSFSALVSQLQTLLLSLDSNPQPVPAPLLYVNLQGQGAGLPGQGAESRHTWTQSHDWISEGSGAALAIGGDYRFIMSSCGEEEEEERDEEEDTVINV